MTITYITSLIAVGLIIYYIAKNKKVHSSTLIINNNKKLSKRQRRNEIYDRDLLQELSYREYVDRANLEFINNFIKYYY